MLSDRPLSDRARPVRRRRRIVAAGLLVLTVLAGLGVHGLLPDTPATDITGDALYAVAVLLFLVALVPRLPPLVAGGIAAGWCIAIELFQLTGVPLALGAQFPPAMLVLGTVFDPRDLVVYVFAIAVATAVDTRVSRVPRR